MSDSPAVNGRQRIERDAALAALCAALFREPDRLIKAHAFPIRTQPNRHPIHAHPDLLQLDVALGCRGGWIVEDQVRPIRGPTATVFYPDQSHGYQLSSSAPGSRVLSVKIRVERGWPAMTERIFASHQSQLQGIGPLVRAWERLIRLAAFLPPRDGGRAGPGSGDASVATALPLRTVRLAEILCLWPDPQAREAGISGADDVVEQVMLHIERNLHRPVPLAELAEVACISARQLARRFAAVCGQSPHAYANARRVALAQDLLLQEGLSITEIAHSTGFGSIHSFSRWFRKETGRSPRQVSHGRNRHVSFS